MLKTTLGALLILIAVFSTGLYAAEEFLWDFEGDRVGKIPTGWKVEATKLRGELASWAVVSETRGGKSTKALAMTKATGNYGGTFNLAVTDLPGVAVFKDGVIEVSFKANSGATDRGGGPHLCLPDL